MQIRKVLTVQPQEMVDNPQNHSKIELVDDGIKFRDDEFGDRKKRI